LHVIIVISHHLLSTNHKCTQPCPTAAQKLKKNCSTLMRSSRRAITPGWLPTELRCLSTTMSLRVFDLVFCKTLFGNKYIILWHWLFYIHFLYGMYVNLIPGHTYYEHLVWPLKLGVTLRHFGLISLLWWRHCWVVAARQLLGYH
jgi:hypothetical protein